MTEHDIQSDIKSMIIKRGGIVIRTNAGKVRKNVVMADPGCPDLIACFHGCFVGIEVKDTGKKAKDNQVDFGERIKKAGGYYIVADSLEKASAALDELLGDIQ
jgi:Holliday junction resolvase